MFKFITRQSFVVNLLVAILLGFFLIWGTIKLLGVITKHGEYLTVPSVIDMPTDKAFDLLESKGFEVVIMDSVFVDTLPRGVVLKQLPDPNSTVKVNRSVYLTVNRVTLPVVEMPALEGKTFNFAMELLKRSHLVLGDTISKPDFMRGAVLEQSYQGKRITPGDKIPWGSAIDLVIGSGLNMEKMKVPDLLGMKFSEAQILLEGYGIQIGAVITEPDVADTLEAFVIKQNPPIKDLDDLPVYIQSGQIMDLWLSKTQKVARDSAVIVAPRPTTDNDY